MKLENTILIKGKELAGLLINALNHPNKKQLGEFLVEQVDEPEILAQILLNTFEKPVFKIGDIVNVKYSDLYTWKMDKNKMNEEGLIEMGDTVKATITHVNPYKDSRYQIKVKIYNPNIEVEVITQGIKQSSIVLGLSI